MCSSNVVYMIVICLFSSNVVFVYEVYMIVISVYSSNVYIVVM